MARNYQDEEGVWWHEFKPGRRIRCRLAVCAGCGTEYPSWRAGKYCSRQCAGLDKTARFTDEQREGIVTMYRAGATLREVAAVYPANEMTILNFLRKQGVQSHRTGGPARVFTEQEKEHAAALYKEGRSLDQIRAALNAGSSVIVKELKAAGIHPGGKRRKGRYMTSQGYIVLEPIAGQRILEHRHIMAEVLGRPLESHETVHHKNGDRADNWPENLELRVGRHGKGATQAHCATCTCFP